jgi:alpha-L-rhamnosidase
MERNFFKKRVIVFSLLTVMVLSTIIIGVTPLANAKSNSLFTVTNLMVENSATPLGLDEEAPNFSWQMKAPNGARGYSQTAYQIVVKDQDGKVVWDTQKVKDDASINIQYNGKDLIAATKYEWKVTVWNQNGKTSSNSSWFETGLMNPDPNLSAWDGATWIGGGDDDLV